MLGFDIRDLFLSVANYFSSKEKNSIQLSFEEGEKLFQNPFNMVTINSEGETDGILIMHYEEQLEELEENGLPLRSNQEIQNTWICLSKEMLDVCLPKLNKHTGILVYKRVSKYEYLVIEARKAAKMHNNPYTTATLSDLLNIQAKTYWWYKNYVRTVDDVMKQLGYKNFKNKVVKNPWIEFVENLDDSSYILEEEKEIIEKFNNKTDDRYKIHNRIMPAPFMGNVLDSPIVLLTLNPGYDEKEEEKGYYDKFRSYWKNEIQHIPTVPDLPLFCLDEEYIEYSDYWMKKLKPLISVTSKDKVAKNISVIQYFPYHSKKYKNIPKRVSDVYLKSQEYNFHLVRKAIDRKALIIVLRSKKLWFEAVPQLDNKRTRFTRSCQNPILSKNNLLETFDDVVNILNKKIL